MANAKSSVILDEGLNAIHSGPFGSHFALKYWLPIYDPRIDEDIHSATQASTDGTGTKPIELSATLIATHEYADLEGEKLFNADSSVYQTFLGVNDATEVYTLPTERNYVVSAMSPTNISVANGYSGTVDSSPTGISASSQERGLLANLVTSGTQALSVVLSATTLTADTSGGFEGTNIGQIPQIAEMPFALDGGVNTSATSLLYPVASFSSVVVSGNNVDAGKYAIRLTANHGNFRFNKFVLFAVKMDVNGNEDTSVLPVPFSVTSFEGTTRKLRTADDGTGLQWSGVIQLAFERNPSLNNLTNLIIDNWTDLDTSAFGLATNKKVHIHDSDGWFESNTKLTVTDNERTQLRLAYSETVSTTFSSDSNGTMTVAVSGGNGDLVFDTGDVYFNPIVDGNVYFDSDVTIGSNVSNEYEFRMIGPQSELVMFPASFGTFEISAFYDIRFSAGNAFIFSNRLIGQDSLWSGLATFNSSATFNDNVVFTQTAGSEEPFLIGTDEGTLMLKDVGSGIFTISSDSTLQINAGTQIFISQETLFTENVLFPFGKTVTFDSSAVFNDDININQDGNGNDKVNITGPSSSITMYDDIGGLFYLSASSTLYLRGGTSIAIGDSTTFFNDASFNNGLDFGDETLDVYKEGSFSYGLMNVDPVVNGTAYYTVIGKVVTIYFPQLQGTMGGGSTSFGVSGIPGFLQPTSAQRIPVVDIMDNSNFLESAIIIPLSNLSWALGKWTGSNYSTAPYTGSVEMGTNTITYRLN